MQIQMGNYPAYEVKYTEVLEFPKNYLRGLTTLPRWITYDVETTGLHLKKDKPFLAAIAWHTDTQRVVFVFPTTKENLMILKDMAAMVKTLYAHNTVYEMHMTANIGGDELTLGIKNWGDTMGILRLVFESLSAGNGGDSLALKQASVKYIDKTANRYEKAVKAALSAKAAADRKILIAMLKVHGWTIKRFEDSLNKGTEKLPDYIYRIYEEWREAYPEPTYQDVPMDIMLPYVATDVILTDIFVEMGAPIIVEKDQGKVLMREFKNLPATFKMTRIGFKVNREYLFECAANLDSYIEDLRIRMHEIAGREFSVGQHAVIKEIYTERLGERPLSTDALFLKKVASQGDELAPLITKLRSMEKWRATYLQKHIEMSEYDGRIYPSLNQFNPVTGRSSGDFQQMPRAPLLTLEGDMQRKTNGGSWTPEDPGSGCDPKEELYYPRKAIINDDDGSKMFFLDFSQEELRFQAHWTLPFGGDTNLCRAYMPFKCVHYETGEFYDYMTEEGKERWAEMRPGSPKKYWEDLLKDGWSAWVVPETGKPWIPTDVHSSTAEKAMVLMNLDPKTVAKDVYKYWRGIGKVYNFMKTYGGGPEKSAEVLDITLEQAYAIDNGFLESFPVVRDGYQRGIEKAFMMKGYITNIYGRRYYIHNARKFYTGANYNIQGSCADDLKEKIIILDRFFTDNNLRSYMLMPIHDEVAYKIYDDEQWIVPYLCEIMKHTPLLHVPLVVEPDYTETNWAEKKAFDIDSITAKPKREVVLV